MTQETINNRNHRRVDFLVHGIFYFFYGIVKYIPSPVGDFLRGIVVKPFLNKCGKVKIKEGVTFIYPYRIEIGDSVSLNHNVTVDGCGGVKIGDFSRIAHNATILSSDHIIENTDVPIFKQGLSEAKVIIGDDCWLGCNSVILPGIHIKKGSVLAANAVLSKSFDEFSVLAGVPAKVISKRGSD